MRTLTKLPTVVAAMAAFTSWDFVYGADPPARDGWTVNCVRGTDEFASNCRAEKKFKSHLLVLMTGDSQIYLELSAMECAPDIVGSMNWWRDELATMSKARRTAVLTAALRDAETALRKQCPGSSRETIMFGDFPDIAVFGAP